MDIKKALAAYRSQKHNAARRGIGWELTFKQWCDWWGEDIYRRGVGLGRLSMQRIADTGPYRLGNIVKGLQRDNVKTYRAMRRNRGQALPSALPLSKQRDELEDGRPDLGYRLMWDRIEA